MDILLDLPISAHPARVFPAVSTPAGLDAWWTERCTGTPALGGTFGLHFPGGYDWRAEVVQHQPDQAFELALTVAMPDWVGTRVGFRLTPTGDGTHLAFHHSGWAAATGHYRTTAYCWALYLRLLARHVTLGEVVPYARRLEV